MAEKLFIAASYSSKVDYDKGEVFPDFVNYLEGVFEQFESRGFEVFCAARADQYKINDADPAAAFRLDFDEIKEADALVALLDENVSAGVQTEIGIAVGLGKTVLLGRPDGVKPVYFNNAMLRANAVQELTLPFDYDHAAELLRG